VGLRRLLYLSRLLSLVGIPNAFRITLSTSINCRLILRPHHCLLATNEVSWLSSCCLLRNLIVRSYLLLGRRGMRRHYSSILSPMNWSLIKLVSSCKLVLLPSISLVIYTRLNVCLHFRAASLTLSLPSNIVSLHFFSLVSSLLCCIL
jgi:hypothetical protein